MKFLSASSYRELRQAVVEFVPGGAAEAANWLLKSDRISIEAQCELDFDRRPCRFNYVLEMKVERDTGDVAAQTELRVVNEQLKLNGDGFDDVTLLSRDGTEARMLHEESHLRPRPAPYTPQTLAPKAATMLSKLYETENNRRAITFRRYLQGWAYFSLNPEAMRYGWQNKAETGALAPNGNNLAQVIFQLKNYDELRYRRLLEHARLLEPRLQAINFVPSPGQAAVPFIALDGLPQASWDVLSDGTLRLIALAYVAETSSMPLTTGYSIPWLSIIEEPENGIAPAYLRQIFELFEERASRNQFLFTSHSPYFIDLFDAERAAVTVLRRSRDYTEIVAAPSLDPENITPERLTLSQEYAAELLE